MHLLNKFERSGDVISEVVLRNLIGMISMPIAFFHLNSLIREKLQIQYKIRKKKNAGDDEIKLRMFFAEEVPSEEIFDAMTGPILTKTSFNSLHLHMSLH